MSTAQKPFAVVLSCSDSRVPPEEIFDQGLGDLFVVRLAGNIVDQAVRGSIAYALKEFTTPAGAVGELVAAIAPAVEAARGRPADQIRTTSELTASLDSGAVKLVVGYYSLRDGTVSII